MLIIQAFVIAIGLYCNLVKAVELPTCQGTAPSQNELTTVRSAYSSQLAGPPFKVLHVKDHHRAFATTGTILTVLDTSTFPPSILHNVSMTYPGATQFFSVTGMSLTPNHNHLLVTAESTVLLVVDTAKALHGDNSSIVGVLHGTTAAGSADIEVSVEGDYAYVSQEYGNAVNDTEGNIEVFKLKKQSNGTFTGDVVGYISLGEAVVGTTFSPHKKYLYATNEETDNSTACVIHGGSFNQTVSQGAVNVLRTAELKKDPASAFISRAFAGYGTVRVIVSANGKHVWVTARESNYLLGYDAVKLRHDPDDALIASVQVGTSPNDLIFLPGEHVIVTADSNRFGYTGATSGLSVVDVKAALKGDSAVLGRVPTGLFPRSFALSHDNKTLLVALYDSEEIQAIDIATLPKPGQTNSTS